MFHEGVVVRRKSPVGLCRLLHQMGGGGEYRGAVEPVLIPAPCLDCQNQDML